MFLPAKSDDQEWIGVIIAIPEPWVTQLTEARLALGDEAAQRVPSHITLVPPTAVDVADRETIIRHLQAVASRRGPFQVTVAGTNNFLPVSDVAFLDLESGADDCASLADEICVGPLACDLRFPYHPHVTLVQGMGPDVLARAEEQASDFRASWTVPGFRLDSVDETGAYTSRAIFDFAL